MFYIFFIKNIFIFIFIFIAFLILIGIEVYQYFDSKGLVTLEDVLHLTNNNKAVIVDLRDTSDYKHIHILSSINIPLSNLVSDLKLLLPYRKKIIIFVHKNDTDGELFFKKLYNKSEFKLRYFRNGIFIWKSVGYPTFLK